MLGRRDGASQGTRALLILLDFQTWATARPWTYSASFAVQEGLVANGVECVTVPAIAEQGCATPASWVYHAREALKGQRFDHVWLWLIHTPLDQATLEWVGELAPVRIGILMESLRYDEQDYQWAPKLRARFPELQRQLPYLTHVLRRMSGMQPSWVRSEAPESSGGPRWCWSGSSPFRPRPPSVPRRFSTAPPMVDGRHGSAILRYEAASIVHLRPICRALTSDDLTNCSRALRGSWQAEKPSRPRRWRNMPKRSARSGWRSSVIGWGTWPNGRRSSTCPAWRNFMAGACSKAWPRAARHFLEHAITPQEYGPVGAGAGMSAV